MAVNVPLVDLQGQVAALRGEIDAAIARTLDSGWYILGRETAAFEAEFAAYVGGSGPAVGCVGVNSGTDALQLALWACGVGPGDEVITVSHTAVATAAAIRLTGATPVLVDIDPATYTMDPATLTAAITPRTKAVIPVHLYGHPADLTAILAVARRHGLAVVEDCAQAHGALYQGRHVGTWGDLGCFSFYPTKNLGALGDGGAVVARDPALVERVRLLREYGWTPQARYVSQVEGMNSRLDEMQAAILRVKLRHLDAWNAARRATAALYAELLPRSGGSRLTLPVERSDCRHVYHLYVVRVEDRDTFRAGRPARGGGRGTHSPVPIPLQPAFAAAGGGGPVLPQTEQAAGEIVSLPMHPLLTREQAEWVAHAARSALGVAG